MYNNRKGEFGVKVIVILLFTVAFFIFWIFNLSQASDLTIDESKINVQLAVDKLFNGRIGDSRCFGGDYGVFEESKFNEEVLSECFKGVGEDMIFRVMIAGESNYLYVDNNKDLFEHRRNFCGTKGNVKCFQLYYPVIFVDKNGIYTDQKLVFEAISMS